MNAHKYKILIVDDDPTNISCLVETLKEEYELVIATSGEDALRLAQLESPPHLVLLDIIMPEMDGYEVCRRLKKNPRTKDIPVIFLTVKVLFQDELKGLSMGAVDYITKPFSIPLVKARIRTHLEFEQFRRSYEKHKLERSMVVDEFLNLVDQKRKN